MFGVEFHAPEAVAHLGPQVGPEPFGMIVIDNGIRVEPKDTAVVEQPVGEVVIFGGGDAEIFVEAADCFERLANVRDIERAEEVDRIAETLVPDLDFLVDDARQWRSRIGDSIRPPYSDGISAIKPRHQSLDPVRPGDAIRVRERDDFARGDSGARVSRGGGPAILLAKIPDRERLCDLGSVVLGTVVDDNDFAIGMRLREASLDTFGECALGVVGGNDDGYAHDRAIIGRTGSAHAMKWTDVSIPIAPGLTVWPGDAAYEFVPSSRIADGEICNVSKFAMSTHAGTHVDAPWHFEDDGKKLHEVETDVFFGPARVIEARGLREVSAKALGAGALPTRMLLKTDNSSRPHDAPFTQDYVALTPDAARRIVDEGVRLVGVDYLSVAPFADPETVHHILLRAGVFIVEGLRLAAIDQGALEFVVLPLALVGADGAPARAFVRR